MQHRQKQNTEGVSIADFKAWEPRSRHTPGPAARIYKGQEYRRWIASTEKNGVEYHLHATKGIRRVRKQETKAN